MNRTLQSPDSNSHERTSHDRFLPRFVGRPIAIPVPQFLDAIHQERRRSERSTKPFVLMLARLQYPPKGEAHSRAVRKLLTVLRDAVRETDKIGWYQEDQLLGVIFTELGDADQTAVLTSLKQRANNVFGNSGRDLQNLVVSFTFHFFPDDSTPPGQPIDFNVYPELSREPWQQRVARGIKRGVDLLGSVLLLAFLFVPLLLIALLIKLTSRGPVLFRQTRIGQHGKTFCFFKFRSMQVNNDATVHQEYVRRFIAGQAELHTVNGKAGVYKITNDPRVTAIGRVLRKTSLDELPQLLNVIQGHMSLIGPRPPVPYEFQQYDLWHRRRVLEIKPGITGLWQVNGRSRTSFDDMVRLDLQYAREWSLWLDLKILWRTPGAVLSGIGAH